MNINLEMFIEALDVLYGLNIEKISIQYLFYLLRNKYELTDDQTKILTSYIKYTDKQGITRSDDRYLYIDFPAPPLNNLK